MDEVRFVMKVDECDIQMKQRSDSVSKAKRQKLSNERTPLLFQVWEHL